MTKKLRYHLHRLGIALGVAALSAILLVGTYLLLPSFQTQTTQNEDKLSMTTVPLDVASALDEAKTSGDQVLGIRADGPSYHIPILLYHYIEHVKNPRDSVRMAMNVTPETFESQIKTLISNGYTFITPFDLADILDGIKMPPAKAIILSFDDGHRDFYTDAFPILKKYNARAVSYVVSGFLNRPDFMTDSQLMEIAKSGLVEIGAHTVDHIALAPVSETKAKEEIVGSKIKLEEELGTTITAFAYPYGSFNLQAIQLVKQAGFRTAMATLPGSGINNSERFFLPRLRPGQRTGLSLLALIK